MSVEELVSAGAGGQVVPLPKTEEEASISLQFVEYAAERCMATGRISFRSPEHMRQMLSLNDVPVFVFQDWRALGLLVSPEAWLVQCTQRQEQLHQNGVGGGESSSALTSILGPSTAAAAAAASSSGGMLAAASATTVALGSAVATGLYTVVAAVGSSRVVSGVHRTVVGVTGGAKWLLGIRTSEEADEAAANGSASGVGESPTAPLQLTDPTLLDEGGGTATATAADCILQAVTTSSPQQQNATRALSSIDDPVIFVPGVKAMASRVASHIVTSCSMFDTVMTLDEWAAFLSRAPLKIVHVHGVTEFLLSSTGLLHALETECGSGVYFSVCGVNSCNRQGHGSLSPPNAVTDRIGAVDGATAVAEDSDSTAAALDVLLFKQLHERVTSAVREWETELNDADDFAAAAGMGPERRKTLNELVTMNKLFAIQLSKTMVRLRATVGGECVSSRSIVEVARLCFDDCLVHFPGEWPRTERPPA